MKHPNHICRFNDGDCTCECYDSGYDDALTAERKLLSKEIERLYWMTELIEDTSDQDYVLGMERNRTIDDILNLINPPSN